MEQNKREKQYNKVLARLINDYGIKNEEELRKAAETNKLYIDILLKKLIAQHNDNKFQPRI